MVDGSTIDLLYEASVVPECWPDALQAVATSVGGFSGILFTTGHTQSGLLCSTCSHDVFSRFVDDGWLARNFRLPRALALSARKQVVTDLDLFTADEMAVDPLYQALRSRGWGWFSGTTATVNNDGDMVGLSFERAYADGPYSPAQADRLAALRPHLARTTLLATRIGIDRHRTAAEAFARIGLPAAVLGRNGRLLVANALFEAEMPAQVLDGRDRLHVADRVADARLAEILRGISLGQPFATGLSLALPVAKGRSASLMHLLPIRRAMHDIFAGALAMAVISPPQGRLLPGTDVLAQLFDLSPREVALAHGVARGDTLAEYAASAGVTANTVKSQLKQVFGKTGVRRQAELVSLMARLSGP